MANRYSPTQMIAFSNLIVFAVLNGFQLITQIPIYYINKWIMPGVDYQDFYQGSLQILNGGSPYQVERFVTPPLFAFVNLPLALLQFQAAHAIFAFLIPFCLLAACLLVYRALRNAPEEENHQFVFNIVLVILFSYPVYFLFERGNIDGVVLFLMCLAVFQVDRYPWLSGLFLALAIHFKLYPVLLLIPLFALRRWKPLLWSLAWTVLLALLMAPYWTEFALLLSKRSNSFQLFENGSLVNTLLFLGRLVSNLTGGGSLAWEFAPLYAAVLFAVFLSVLVLADTRLHGRLSPQDHAAHAFLYFPFMVALPKSVYHYEFVVLIALLPILDFFWRRSTSDGEAIALGVMAVGLALSQWQAVALHLLTANMAAYYIPGFGLLLLMIGIVIFKFIQLRRSKIIV
jgi:hypothetical protein